MSPSSTSQASRPVSSSRRPMLRLLGWSLGTLVLSNVIVEMWGIHTWQPFTHPAETARLAEAGAESANSEILLAGSSLVQNGFRPKTLTRTLERSLQRTVPTYNMGMIGAGTDSVNSCLGSLASSVRPRILVYGTTLQEMLPADQYNPRRFFRAFASPWAIARSLGDGVASYRELSYVASSFFRPPAILLQLPWARLGRLAEHLGKKPTRYQRELADARAERGWFSIGGNGPPGSWRYRPVASDWSALERIYRKSVQMGARLVIVHMPENMERARGRLELRETFSGHLAAFCRERNIVYRDLNHGSYVPTPTEYGQDGRHLSADGAMRLSRNFARDVLAPLLQEMDAEAAGQPVVAGREHGSSSP